MPVDVKQVHLASSIEELNKKATLADFRKFNDSKCIEMSQKLYKKAMELNKEKEIDQELMYIFLFRSYEMWNKFLQSDKYLTDKKFYNLMFGKEVKIMISLMEDLSSKLGERYKKLNYITKCLDRTTSNNLNDIFDLKTSVTIKKKKEASGKDSIGAENCTESSVCVPDMQSDHYDAKKFINVHEMLEKIDSPMNLLVIDIRTKEDFLDSHIKNVHCVNIPDNFIVSGLSANKLRERVEDMKQKQFWDDRDKYNQLVLMDWQSEDKDVIPSCPLFILLHILLKWDPHIVYKNKPLILSGGFVRILDTFPTFTSNPKAQCPAKNALDLRDLEVDYPMSELDEISNPMPRTIIQPADVHKPTQSNRPLIDRTSKPDTTLKKFIDFPVHDVTSEENMEVTHISLEPTNIQDQEECDTNERLTPISKQMPGEHMPPSSSPSPLVAEVPPRPLTPPRVHQYSTPPTTKQQKGKGDGEISSEPLKHDPTSKSSLKRSSSSPNINKLNGESSVMPMYDRSNKPNQYSPGYYSPRVSGMDTVLADPKNHPGRGLAGLKNLGNTCYMNSILQCISNTVELNKELTRFDKGALATRRQIASEVRSVLETLWADDVRSMNCRSLKVRVGNLKKSFATYEQQDAHEFFTLMLDWLHEDLNQLTPGRSLEGAEESTGEKAWGEYRLKNNSVVLDLFYGQHKSTVTCTHCQKQSIRFEPFSNLSLPLPQEPAYGRLINLQECLKLYLKSEKISGWVCPNCKTPRDATQKLDITRLPPVLVLHLKRFSSGATGSCNKRLEEVDYPLTDLDMKPFTYFDSELRHHNYNLYAVSNHYGSMEGGHYHAFCKNYLTNKWYKFDDTVVESIDAFRVKTSAAYILFYESSRLHPTLE